MVQCLFYHLKYQRNKPKEPHCVTIYNFNFTEELKMKEEHQNELSKNYYTHFSNPLFCITFVTQCCIIHPKSAIVLYAIMRLGKKIFLGINLNEASHKNIKTFIFQIVEPPYTISLLTIFPFLEHGEIYWWNTALWHVYAILNVVCMMKKCILKLQNTEALDCNICILLLCIIIRGEKQLCNNNGMIFHHEFTTNSKTDSWLPIK